MPLTDQELYEGFPKDQLERYRREVGERHNPAPVKEVDRRV